MNDPSHGPKDNPPTSLFEAAQRGMKMKPPQMAPPKTTKELAKQLVESTYELKGAIRAASDAQERMERVEGEIKQARDGLLKEWGGRGTKAILVTTQVCQKVVTIRMDDASGVVVEVLDLEEQR